MVTGAQLPIGRRVVIAALAEPGVDRVIAVGADPDPRRLVKEHGDGAELVVAPFALDDARLASLVSDAAHLILLGPREGLDIDGTGGSDIDLVATRAFLATLAGVAQITTMAVLSSALVYGARPENPVPLTESAAVRPNSLIGAATQRAELEHLCSVWAASQRATCAIMRPCVVVGPENEKWLARSPWSTAGLLVSGGLAPVQFVHLDDLTTAIIEVCRARYNGPINVAPDGWLSVNDVRALKGPAARLRLGRSLAHGLARLGERFGVAASDPDILVATTAPWVVDNAKLRSLGWIPTQSNEEAYVDSDRGSAWSRLPPPDRQKLLLGVAGCIGVALIATATAFVRKKFTESHSPAR